MTSIKICYWQFDKEDDMVHLLQWQTTPLDSLSKGPQRYLYICALTFLTLEHKIISLSKNVFEDYQFLFWCNVNQPVVQLQHFGKEDGVKASDGSKRCEILE